MKAGKKRARYQSDDETLEEIGEGTSGVVAEERDRRTGGDGRRQADPRRRG